MTTFYLTIGLTYLVIGFAMTILFFYIFRKPFIGRFWGALIVALIGSFLGGLINYFFQDIITMMANLNNSVNVFPPLIASYILVRIYSRISETHD
jgi:hypothetical protein